MIAFYNTFIKKGLIAFIMLTLALTWSCSDDKKETKKISQPVIKEAKKKETKSKEATKSEPEAQKEEQTEPVPPEQIEKAKEIIAAATEEDIKAVDAKAKFKMLCAACHGFTGDLKINGAKDLTISKLSQEERVAQIYHGRGLMTPYKGILSDAEIVAVAKYIEEELIK